MRTYTIDQLHEDDIAIINGHLLKLNLQAGLEGVYWLPIANDMLTTLQKEHLTKCGPYCLALQVDSSAINLELLVRGMERIHCDCITFASPALLAHMIAYLEEMLHGLGIHF